jgi:phosphotransferase system HPr (HPr) family protein
LGNLHKSIFTESLKWVTQEEKMIKKEVVITNPSGLHARPAAGFVVAAGKFSSDIFIRNLDTGKNPVSAKSMVMVLSQELSMGSHVELTASGTDEVQAIESLVALIEKGCGESS